MFIIAFNIFRYFCDEMYIQSNNYRDFLAPIYHSSLHIMSAYAAFYNDELYGY